MINNTYIVSNTRLIDKLKTIPEFELDLGQSLTSSEHIRKSKNNEHLFLPSDVNIQTHYTYRNEIINKIAHLGNLIIYTKNDLQFNEVLICNLEKAKSFFINPTLNIYDELNRCFNEFLIHFEFITEDTDEPEINNNNSIQNTKENTSNTMYMNEDSDNDIDMNIRRPIVSNEEIEKNKNKIKNNPILQQIKGKKLSDLTEEERILYARSL